MAKKRASKDPNDPARLARIAARREIDEALVRHWPGLVEKEDDGWVMRFSKAYTRWANAVFPLESGRYPLEKKLEIVEPLYIQQKQRPLFRLTLYTQPESLDKHLADNGYARVGRTSVLTADLTGPPPPATIPGEAADGQFFLHDDLNAQHDGQPSWLHTTNRWLAYDTKGDGSDAMPQTRPAVMRNFLYDTRYATYHAEGKPIAAAIYVVNEEQQQGFVTNLMVAGGLDKTAELRHRVALMRHLLTEARAAGLHRLIVEADMEKDDLHEHLTEHLGLEERYRYWYRAKMFF